MCAHIVNDEYYSKSGGAPAQERAELQRIMHEALEKKMAVGMVRAWVLTPDGHPYDILDGAALAGLQRAVEHFKPTPGKPVVPPGPQSVPPPAPADAIALHLISRGNDRGSWGEIPAEDWIVLTRADWSKLVPTVNVNPGEWWELDRGVSAKILTHFYPQTENTDANPDRIVKLLLIAKALTVKDGVVTARIDGYVMMHHVFYPGRNDAQRLGAEIVGVMTFAPNNPPSLELVTTKAYHGQRWFTVAVRTVPHATTR